MAFRINGTQIEVKSGLTIDGLLKERKINPEQIVVEYNNEILLKKEFDTTEIKDGDNVEILSFVGGG